MDANSYAYNGQLWSRCPTTSDNNSFFHAAFGVRPNESREYFDKQAEFRRICWGGFLTYFKNENMPACLAVILRKCFSVHDKYKKASIDNTQDLAKYISDVMGGDQAVTKEEIPILATLENVKVVVLSNGTPDSVIIAEPNPNIFGTYSKELPKGKPREVVLCLEENIFVRLEPIGSKKSDPKFGKIKIKKKLDPTKYRKGGSAGSKGVEYQISLLTLVILNALKNALNGWKLSTENEEAGKFDDIVLEWSGGVILIQSKHKEDNKKRITLEELTSTNSKNDDFSLPKYFLSYLQIKETFNIKNIIICTNAGVHEKALKFLDRQPANSDNLLYHPDGDCSFYMLNYKLLPDLKEKTLWYYQQNCKNKRIEKSVFTDKNLKDFLEHLQIYFNYPLKKLEKIIEKLLTLAKYCSTSKGKITPLEIFSKVIKWFQHKDGIYFTNIYAKAMFAEIWRDKYCQKLEQCKVCLQKNDMSFQGPKQIFHIATSRGYLLEVIKIYYALQNDKAKILFINPDDDIDTQRAVVEAFVKIPLYVYLIIIKPQSTDKSITEEIYGELRHIFNKTKYKKIILLAEDSELARQIELDDIVSVDGSVTFEDLSLTFQQFLLQKNIINFQGNTVTLEQLFSTETVKDYGSAINSDILEKLVIREEIKVGMSLSDLDKETFQCYINRTLKRTLDVNQDEELDEEDTEKVFSEELESLNLKEYVTPNYMNHQFKTEIDRQKHRLLSYKKKEETLTEESIYNLTEKFVLIADSAGTGKTTILNKLALTVKESNPCVWVIRVILNDFTGILKYYLNKGKETISLEELLNSKDTSKLTNHLERCVFASSQKVVLLLDGIDEISPDYTKLILGMLTQCKKESSFAKIFVTTRPHMIKDLEAVFDVKPFILQPFTEQNQLNFLTSYWAHNLELKSDTSREKCKRYAKAMINNIFWANLEDDKDNHFVSLPLHLRMAAEIFQENSKLFESTEWVGCKEYIMGDEEEPKLTKRIHVTRLYELFVEKKRDIFVEKGNPTENAAANRALTEQFNQCLVYHQSLALEVILGEDKCVCFSTYRRGDKNIETDLLKMGVVQKLNNQIHFAHRTFADYFVAECLLTELQQNQTLEFQKLLIDTIFLYPQYNTTRMFFDNLLQKVVVKLPPNIFKKYQSVTQETTWESYKLQSGLIHLLAREGCITTLQFLLKCVRFETITGNEINIRDCYESDFEKDVRENIFGNTLNILEHLTRQAGINIIDEEGRTPLHLAAENDHLEMMKYFIELGVNISSTTIHGDSVLCYAARFGNLSTVQYLENLGVDINIRNTHGDTVLHLAAQYGQLDTVQFLVNYGLDANITCKYGSTPLHLASINGYLEIVQFLLEHDADGNIKDSCSRTALLVAAHYGHLNIVRFLMEHGLDANVIDKYGFTLLHAASLAGHLEIVQFLLDYGVDCNIKNNDGFTALHGAAYYGHLHVVRFLVENSLDFNVTDEAGITPLISASTMGHLEIVQFLLECGVDCKIKDSYGYTALHAAADYGHLNVVMFLVKNGLDVNATNACGNTPLHLASIKGQLEVVQFLFEHGADCKITNNNSSTALHAAVDCGQLNVVKFLGKNGVDVNVTNKHGSSPLHSASIGGHLEMVQFFLELGIDCTIKDNDSLTALHIASHCGHLNVVKVLLENSLDVNAINIYGDTPLHASIIEGHLEIVQYLLEHGIDCTIKDVNGFTALHIAADYGHLNVVKVLVENGSDVNVTNKYGGTPLYLASVKGHSEVVQFLLGYGADCTITDDNGFTPLHVAADCGHLNVAKFLVQNGSDFRVTSRNGITPLHLAVSKVHLEIVSYLLDLADHWH